MKKTLLKVGAGAGLYGLTLGGSIAWIKLIGKFWEKREITEEFVEEHPVLTGLRIGLRLFTMLIAPIAMICGVCCDLIWRACDIIEVTFPDKKEEKED